MLSDDVSGAVGTTVSKTGAFLGGTVRGGFLGGAIAFVGGALTLGTMAGITAATTGGATITAAAGAAVIGTVTGATAMITVGLPLVIGAAVIGAALLGLGSVIPGVSDMWNGAKKLFTPKEKPPVQYVQVEGPPPPQQTVVIEHKHPAPRPVVIYDNPNYVEGHGAKMMEKGNCAESTHICR